MSNTTDNPLDAFAPNNGFSATGLKQQIEAKAVVFKPGFTLQELDDMVAELNKGPRGPALGVWKGGLITLK